MSEQSVEREPEEMKIDLLDIFSRIIAIRKKLYKAAIIGLLIGIIVWASIPKKYTVTVMLSPEMSSDKGSNGLSGLAASFLGGGSSFSSGTDALNASLSSDIVASTPFLLELLNMEVVDNGEVKRLSDYLNTESFPWWNYIIGAPSRIIAGVQSLFINERKSSSEKFQDGIIILNKKVKGQIDVLKKNITAAIDKKTAITNVSVSLQNPSITAIVADSVVHRLQERKQEYYAAQKKYAKYVDTHDNLVLQSIRAEQERLQNDMSLAYQVYSQVINQLQIARAKVQEEKPVFAVVEPPVVPLKPSGIGVKIYVLLFVFFSLFITVGWELLGRNILDWLKKQTRNEC